MHFMLKITHGLDNSFHFPHMYEHFPSKDNEPWKLISRYFKKNQYDNSSQIQGWTLSMSLRTSGELLRDAMQTLQ